MRPHEHNIRRLYRLRRCERNIRTVHGRSYSRLCPCDYYIDWLYGCESVQERTRRAWFHLALDIHSSWSYSHCCQYHDYRFFISILYNVLWFQWPDHDSAYGHSELIDWFKPKRRAVGVEKSR
jgi:hypothetical protein